ncbi:type II toxin-antitoxin system RelE/ParE family toxin [Paraburkholderia gardini]|uniref:type II toxin-antitoxin system RelE/ParE family toxin n=1 Tax=Paraburkholderia gardini TaxID=2823469 RepID=UPI002B4B9A42|nr:type II toxin-antitoxin system RelE/ParE family toxin [Paraburkholderia gardini]
MIRAKIVAQRKQAAQDVQDAIACYLGKGSQHAALGLIDALEAAYSHIERRPQTGSTRYAYELDLPGLRSWSLSRYPYLVFYFERDDHIDVWRILHVQRDIPSWLLEN